MRLILLSLLVLATIASCKKTGSDPGPSDPGTSTPGSVPGTVLVDLDIISTITPATTSQGQEIVSNVKCSGPDLCYKFARFEINETNRRQFDIKAKANYPDGKNGNAICLQAIYYVDTTLRINAKTTGQYLLKFYNKNLLFKVDTVQVN